MKRTVMQVFDETASRHGGRPALAIKKDGRWAETTWSEYREQTRRAARAFMHLGVQLQTGVSILGYNCPQWAIADMAAIFAGAFPAGIYTTNSPDQCAYIADHSDSVVAVVENQEQLAKFKAVRDRLPKLKALVLMWGEDADDDVYSWEQFLALSEHVSEEQLDARIAEQSADDVCTFIYTSGTTGDPKAVMITHDNITWTAASALNTLGVQDGDRTISYLPLSHIAEQVVSLHGPMVGGGCTYFAESLDALGDNLREVRPTIFLAVPRVWEKIQAKMAAAGKDSPPLRKKLVAWARRTGLRAGYAVQEGGTPGLRFKLADKLIYSKVRDKLGLDQARACITSAAPISRDTLEFFLSLGIPIMEVYGMSECTGPATLSLPDKYRTGSVGWVIPGGEIKIAEDGEICMRGRHVFKGYYKSPEQTAETIDAEGWLHSGDIGEIDGRGFVRITDRKKDLLITAGGENIAPQAIEGELKAIPAVAQAVVVGDRKKHLSALLTLDPEKLRDSIAEAGSPAKTMEEAASCPKVHGWLMNQVEQVNGKLARVQTIKKIAVLPQDLTVEGGELTPTMKVKRKVVNEKYAAQIDAFYA